MIHDQIRKLRELSGVTEKPLTPDEVKAAIASGNVKQIIGRQITVKIKLPRKPDGPA